MLGKGERCFKVSYYVMCLYLMYLKMENNGLMERIEKKETAAPVRNSTFW